MTAERFRLQQDPNLTSPDRMLMLLLSLQQRHPLGDMLDAVLRHVRLLCGFRVRL